MQTVSRSSETLDASVRVSDAPAFPVSDDILGHNLESMAFVVHALTADRLANAGFAGPADPQTGIAAGWLPTDACMGDTRCQLTAGMSLSGTESQLVQRYGFLDEGIQQTGVSIRKGETLEIEIWAKARHRPVPLRFELTPLTVRKPAYATAELTVDTAYWKRFTVRLDMPHDDDQAVFKCRLLDEGTLWIDQLHLRPANEGPFCREILQRIASLQIPVLRFPGGCMSTNYHWRLGTGPVHLRPTLADPVFKQRTLYTFGTDEFLTLCLAQGIRPHVTVNVGSGTPEDAAAWAAYCADWYRNRGETPPPAYFQIGNEHYGVHETAHMTGDMYVDALKAFVPPIREAYPGCRIVALGPTRSAGLRPAWRTPWLVPIMEKAADCFDILAINRYKGQWNDSALDQQINAVESVPKIENDLRALIRELRSRGLQQKVALTEWNYWLHAAQHDGQDFHEPGDALHGFFVAGALNMFARLGEDMTLANYYHLVQSMGIFRRQGARVSESCIADVFKLYRPALPARFLPLDTASPKLGPTESMLDALALQSDAGRWLFLANRSPDQALSVSLEGFPDAGSADPLLCAGTPQQPFRKAKVVRKRSALVLPPLSLCRLHAPNS